MISDYNLILANGNYKKFIELPDQKFQLNLLKLVAPEVTVALSVALRKLLKDNLKVVKKRVNVKKEKFVQILDLVV